MGGRYSQVAAFENDGIYKMDTVPPPASGAGEADLYDSPTRIGSVDDMAIVEMFAEAERERAQANEWLREPRTESGVRTIRPSDLAAAGIRANDDEPTLYVADQAKSPVVTDEAPVEKTVIFKSPSSPSIAASPAAASVRPFAAAPLSAPSPSATSVPALVAGPVSATTPAMPLRPLAVVAPSSSVKITVMTDAPAATAKAPLAPKQPLSTSDIVLAATAALMLVGTALIAYLYIAQ